MKTKSFSILMLLTMAFWLVACAGVETGRRRAEVGEVTGKDDSYNNKKDIPQREDSRRASGTAWEGTAPEGLAGTALGNEGLAGEAGTPGRAGAVPPPSSRGKARGAASPARGLPVLGFPVPGSVPEGAVPGNGWLPAGMLDMEVFGLQGQVMFRSRGFPLGDVPPPGTAESPRPRPDGGIQQQDKERTNN